MTPPFFESNLELAKPSKRIWAITFGLVQIILVAIALLGSQIAIVLAFSNPSEVFGDTFANTLRLYVFLVFGSFAIALVSLYLTTKYVEKVSFNKLISAFGKFRIKAFFSGIIICALVFGISIFIATQAQKAEILGHLSKFDWRQILQIIFIGFIAFGVQSFFEEAYFRAFIPQQFKKMGVPLWLVMLLSSVIFVLPHYSPGIRPETLFGIFMLGLSFAIITHRTGGIEAAYGMHFTNNFIVGVIAGQINNAKAQDYSWLEGFILVLGFVLLTEALLKFFPSIFFEGKAV